MKLGKREVKTFLVLGGLLILAVCYFAVFTPFQDRTNELSAQLVPLREEVQELESHLLRINEYEVGIETISNNVNEIMQAYPADVKEEDVLSYLLTMEAKEEVLMESVTFNNPVLVSQFPAMIEGENKQYIAKDMNVYRTSTLMTGRMSYPQVKRVINYLYNSPKQTTLENVVLTYNGETGALTTSLQLAKYFIQWDGAEYIPESVPNVSLGVKDLFGST